MNRHHTHDYEELHKAFDKYTAEITASLEPMEKQLISINKALAQLDTRCGEISNQQAAVEVVLHDTFRQLQEILDVRKTQLIGQLHQMTQRKLKGLAVQRDQLETIEARIRSSLGFMRESIKTGHGSEGEVLIMKSALVKQVKELTTTLPPDVLNPCQEADMVFSTPKEIMVAFKNYGHVSAPGSPDPLNCHVTGKGLKVAVVGETSNAILQAFNFKGRPCDEAIKSSECELVSEITGTRVRGSIERKGQSQYEISYQPTIKGNHQLHIRVDGQHIRGSPFSVAVTSTIDKLSTPILTLTGLQKPVGITINRRGDLVISERGAHCISVFSHSGKKLHSFGTRGPALGQFISPRGVAVDGEGNTLVIDRYNHRIQKFTIEGQFLTAVGTKGSGPLQFYHPACVAFNTSNNKIYVTDNSHRVKVLNSDLTFSSTFGKPGSGKGQFNYPRGIACDSTGKVYVADCVNHRIQVLTSKGKFLHAFGKHGEGRGELFCPDGIAIDTSDMVYVVEINNHRVSVFTSDGGFVTLFGSHGKQPGQFQYPYGIAVNNSGIVYVCDSDNHCVQIL